MLRVGENQEYYINTNDQIQEGAQSKILPCYKQVGDLQFQLCAKIIYMKQDKKLHFKKIKEIWKFIKQKQNLNIVAVHHLEKNEQKTCLTIVMEKCISTLHKELEEKGKYQEQEILDFLRQFINGYKVLSDSDIIHRDIKPENILIQKYGNKKYYKLADFDLATISKLNDLILTTRVGTPMFASPELNPIYKDDDLQLGINKFYQRNVVDMYSLGMILHRMITGEYPCIADRDYLIDFISELKIKCFKLEQSDSEILKLLVEGMIVYQPEKRMSFQQLCEIIRKHSIVPQINIQPNFNQNNKQVYPPNQIRANFQQNPQQIFQGYQQKDFLQQNPGQLFKPYFRNQTIQPNKVNLQNPIFQSPKVNLNNPIFQPAKINEFKTINIQKVITCYLKKIKLIYKNILNPDKIQILDDYILGNSDLKEVQKLFDNFDKTIDYNQEDIEFYYCLKYGLKNQASIAPISSQEQLKDLCR